MYTLENPTVFEILSALTDKNVVALLIVMLSDDDVLLHPIMGSKYSNSIVSAIRRMYAKYPNCSKMRLFERDSESWINYFKGNVPESQVLF